MRCEDYPCCGHGPPPLGDGGGCPDSQGRFNCVCCGRKLAKHASSSICPSCVTKGAFLDPEEREEMGFYGDEDDADEDGDDEDEEETVGVEEDYDAARLEEDYQ